MKISVCNALKAVDKYIVVYPCILQQAIASETTVEPSDVSPWTAEYTVMHKYWPYRVSCALYYGIIPWHLTFIDKAIEISGSRLYELGGTANITCSTPVPVQSIQWVNESNTVVRGGVRVQELPLTIMSLNSTHDNTMYRCVISDGRGFMESRNITIHVGRKSSTIMRLSISVLISYYITML